MGAIFRWMPRREDFLFRLRRRRWPTPNELRAAEAGVRNTKKGPRALEDKEEEEREQSSLSSRIDRLDWTGRAGGRERGETLPPPLLT